MKTYNWQQSDWPNFRYDVSTIHETLFAIAEKTGLINGKPSHLTENLKTEAMMQAGIGGFEGGMSAKKYMTMAGTSKALSPFRHFDTLAWPPKISASSIGPRHYML